MNTYAEYLNTLTVVELRAIARQAGYVGSRGVSRTRKAELVNLVAILSSNDEDVAYDMDAVIEEAYQGPAADAGITIGAYLACQKAHTNRGEIRISGFWNCPREEMTKAIVFDNGQKQAVPPADASFYSGQTLDMPETGHDEVCSNCGETYFIESTDIAEIQDLLSGNPWDEKAPVSEEIAPRAFDSTNALKVMIAALTPLADMALKATEATITGPVRDMHYQAYLDMSRAADEMRRTLAFFGVDEEHVCSFQREIGMSGCTYGCKIYQCTKCDAEQEMHNATYGCKG